MTKVHGKSGNAFHDPVDWGLPRTFRRDFDEKQYVIWEVD